MKRGQERLERGGAAETTSGPLHVFANVVHVTVSHVITTVIVQSSYQHSLDFVKKILYAVAKNNVWMFMKIFLCKRQKSIDLLT